MSGKVRVPQYGKPQGFVTIDPTATRGATIGVNVWNRDGSLFEPGAIATPAAGQASGVVIWQRVMQIPANVVSAAAIATEGFVRRDGAGDWTASAIVNADLSSADTGGLAEGTNLYFTDGRADARIDAQKGVALGLAPLNSATQIDLAYIPASVLGQVEYKGVWDASTGAAPTATPEKGWYYVTTVAGSTNLDGITDWKVGDWAIYSGTAWNKVDNTDAIASWNGRTGIVMPQVGDYTAADVGADPAGTAAAVVTATITNGDTTHAPSGDAVFDALALKFDKAGGQIAGNTTVAGSLKVERFAGSPQSLTALLDGVGNSFTSLSDPAAAKEYIFNATTDAVGTPPTAGSVGIRFSVLSVSRWKIDASSALFPNLDNTFDVGKAANRPREFYAGNAVINTSDAREKDVRGPLNAQELAAAQELASAAVIYQWKAAIAEKGEAARLHCSPTVQSVIEIMEKHGLDPFRYGFVCFDEWGEQPEIRDEWPEERDEEGNVTREAGSEVTQEYRPAGDRYSLRPSELESFIAAGLAKRVADLDARLIALGG